MKFAYKNTFSLKIIKFKVRKKLMCWLKKFFFESRPCDWDSCSYSVHSSRRWISTQRYANKKLFTSNTVKNFNCFKRLSINDVTVLRGRGQAFCDNSTKMLDDVGRGWQKYQILRCPFLNFTTKMYILLNLFLRSVLNWIVSNLNCTNKQ